MKKLIKLDFTLEQIVSMIHFQGDEEGATIRATELKPKLDRFLYRKLASDRNLNWNVNPLLDEEKNMIETVIKDMSTKNELSQWLIEVPKMENGVLKIKNHALNYRVKISVNKNDLITDDSSTLIKQEKKNKNGGKTRVYYGAAHYILKEESNAKNPVIKREGEAFGVHKVGKKFKKINVEIICYDENVANTIEKVFPVFIVATGFGYASGKGYGSFSVVNVLKNGQKSKLYQKANCFLVNLLLKEYRKIMNYKGNNIMLCCLEDDEGQDVSDIEFLDIIAEFNHYLKSGYNFPMRKIYNPSPLMKVYFKSEKHINVVNEKKAMIVAAEKGNVVLKCEPENRRSIVLPANHRKVYTRGLFGFAVEYFFLLEPSGELIFSVEAKTNDGTEINRFANPISYRVVKEDAIHKVYMIIDLHAIEVMQELKPTITMKSNNENVNVIDMKLPSKNDFSMREYMILLCDDNDDYLYKKYLKLSII